MKINKLFSLLLALFFSIPSITWGQQNEMAADEMIEFLHNKGILLVRLQTNLPKINALKKAGKTDEAAQVAEETKLFNDKLVEAFDANYKFCPVYFFYSDNSLKIQNLDFSEIFNAQGKEIYENPNYFLVVDYGKTDNMNIEGLIVKNENFDQLDAPFPYFVRRYTAFGMKKRSLFEMVKILNSKFFKLYEKANIPAEKDLQQNPMPEPQ